MVGESLTASPMPQLVVVKVAAAGMVELSNVFGAPHLIADVADYYTLSTPLSAGVGPATGAEPAGLAGGNAHDDHTGGDRPHDCSSRADDAACADGEALRDACARPYRDVVLEHDVTGYRGARRDRDPIPEGAVVPDRGIDVHLAMTTGADVRGEDSACADDRPVAQVDFGSDRRAGVHHGNSDQACVGHPAVKVGARSRGADADEEGRSGRQIRRDGTGSQ